MCRLFREKDLRKLDADREGLTEEEFQARRKKLFTERTRVLKTAYDRKVERLKRQTGASTLDDDEAARVFFCLKTSNMKIFFSFF